MLYDEERIFMTQIDFIKSIASFVQKYSPQYSIKVCSPIIAQAILESASGTSELAVNAHNYFGLKYRAGRCPSSCGIYVKVGSEQNSDGSYSYAAMQWMKFPTMEFGVKGYFEFINIPTYANLKGVTNPETYLKNIKADGYATSLNYVQNLMNIIKKYNLTQYDNPGNNTNNKNNQLKINIHAGHNPDGKIACGAVGFIKESTEARNIKNKVISMLTTQGHIVYDCTVDNGISQNDVLKKIISKCNSHSVDLDISIHFNSGVNDKTGNRTTTGTEAYVYSSASKAKVYAQNISNHIASLGFKNRGVKTSSSLYFLKNTKSPALLVECCFVDDKDDADLYNADKMAQAIVKGITGKITPAPPQQPIVNTSYSKRQFIKDIQAAIGAKVDGIVGSETLSKTITVSKNKNNKHAVVKPIQKYLNFIGFDCGNVDGVAGVKFDAAVKSYQKKNNCVTDGEITKSGNTWKKLLGLK